MVDAHDLVTPVYLNQRIVFDLVAVLQGGIASVTQVSQTQSQTEGKTQHIGASFGVSEALSSLLKINLTGNQDKSTADESSRTTKEDRIHTPVSLFITLRAILREKGHLKIIDESSPIAPGDIIEFSSVLKRNPLLETLDSFVEMIDMFEAFVDPPQKGRGKQNKELAQVKKQISSLTSSLKNGDTMDLTTPTLPSSRLAVISLETQNLNDPTMSDLVDGTFRVVGKVTRRRSRLSGKANPPKLTSDSFAPRTVIWGRKSKRVAFARFCFIDWP